MEFKEPKFSKKGAEQFYAALDRMNDAVIKKGEQRKTPAAKKKTTPKKK